VIGFVSGLGVATADGFYAALAAFGIGADHDQISSVRAPVDRPSRPGGCAVAGLF